MRKKYIMYISTLILTVGQLQATVAELKADNSKFDSKYVFNENNQSLFASIPPIHYTGRVTPTPRKVYGTWTELPLKNESFNVKTANHAHKTVQLAANLLRFRVADQSKNLNHIKSVTVKPVIIYLGTLESEFIRDKAEKLKINIDNITLQPHGYIIRKAGNKIIAAGVDTRGTFYAAATLYQSIGAPDGQLLLRVADLDDWPVWTHRYYATYILPDEADMLFMALNKLSGLLIQRRSEWRNIKPDEKIKSKYYNNTGEALSYINAFKTSYGLLDTMFLFNIYARSTQHLNIADKQDVQQLINTCKYIAESGIDHIVIAADDFTHYECGHYTCSYPEEKKQFNDSIGKAHGFLMRKINNAILPLFPEIKLAFVPAAYSLFHDAIASTSSNKRYLRDMAAELPANWFVVWTGPLIRSWEITRNDFLIWQQRINNKQSSYVWDNTGYPPIIKRWTTKLYNGFATDSHGIYFLNGDLFGRLYRMPFNLSANDYLWNPKGFKERESYHDAVEKLYPGSGELADRFIDNLQKIEDSMNNNDKASTILNELENLIAPMEKCDWSMKAAKKILKDYRNRLNSNPPVLKIHKTSTPPVLDGKLDDPCWKNVSSFNFIPVNDRGKSKTTGNCSIIYDRNYIYFGFRLPRTKPLDKINKLPHDSTIWKSSDNIQMFILGESGTRAQFIFDYSGNKAERGGWQIGQVWKWDPEWDVSINAENNKDWTAEVKMPLALPLVIEKKVTPGTVWHANFFRKIKNGKTTCWSPTKGNKFSTKEFYGNIIFE